MAASLRAMCCRNLTRGLRQLAPCAKIRLHPLCTQSQPACAWGCPNVHPNCSYTSRHVHNCSLRMQRSSLSFWQHQQQICIRNVQHLSTNQETYDFQQLATAVEGELGSESEVRERQLRLLSAIAKDVSEPSKQLLMKLNIEPNLSAEEMYKLAVAVFQVRDQVGSHALELAFSLFECAGEMGDLNGLYTCAQLLRTGQGCSPDAPRAARIFTDLAMKGHPYAQFALAGMYYAGIGVDQNFNRAFSLYSVCAQNFVPQAHNILGEMFRHGQGVEESMEEAIKHYNKGAELGDPLAHLSLALCYTHGKGVEQSYEKAFEHHLKASESGPQVCFTSATMDLISYPTGLGLKFEWGVEQIEGIPIALYNVGGHYFAGKGVELSFEKAAEYYKKAADMRFAPAQVNLGNMYYNGLGVPKDKAKARALYTEAADSDKNAQALLEELDMEEQREREQQEKEHSRSKEDSGEEKPQ